MILHPMYVHVDDRERTIGFEVNLHAASLLGHLRLIQFVTVRYDGERQAVSRTVRGADHPFGATSVRFPADRFEAAKAFCADNIMDNGSPTAAFHHELEHAALSAEVDKGLHWAMTGEPNNPYRTATA